MLKNNKVKAFFGVFILFVFSHMLLVNFNSAEWGDSYRILRAAEHIKQGSYPSDEKRPPAFSYILAKTQAITHIEDPILNARLVMLSISIICFGVFGILLSEYVTNTLAYVIGLAIFGMHPVIYYWSLRVYADIPFTLYVLVLTIIFMTFRKKQVPHVYSLLWGIVSGLSPIIRFEGYIALASMIIAYSYVVLVEQRKTLSLTRKLVKMGLFGVGVMAAVVPLWWWRNPLATSYLAEPVGRAYDLTMIATFVVSLVFLHGFLFPTLFIQKETLLRVFKQNLFWAMFVGLDLILILMWPAAIPRLFVAVIPMLVVVLTLGIQKYIENPQVSWAIVLKGFVCVFIYVLAQYFLKLQFLIVLKPIFTAVVLINVLALVFMYIKKPTFSLGCMLLSVCLWTGATLSIHKDIYRSLKEGSEYATTLEGKVAYNDINSVSDWYLNYRSKVNSPKGYYEPLEISEKMSKDYLKNKGYSYLLVTNEHVPGLKMDFNKYHYLEQIKEFRYNVNGGEFYTKIIKVR